LESELIVQATVHLGTEGDAETLVPSVVKGQANLIRAGVIPHSRNCSWLDVGDKLHLRV
jgi:hypothetical protein